MPVLGNRKKLDIYEFGRQLIETQDLDPVYVCVYHAKLDLGDLRKWLTAYLCFYHMGTASWITYGDTLAYWKRMETAAGSKEYPRGTERRHFRGDAATRSVAYLKDRGLKDLWDPLTQSGPLTLRYVMNYIQGWVGFGPWIAFKAADMIERLRVNKVIFDDAAMFLFDSPKKGARDVWEAEGGGPEELSAELGGWAVSRLLSKFGGMAAPPGNDRHINEQEVETILCKYHSYLGGHYEVGKDTKECRHALLRFAHCPLSQELLRGGKRGGLW